MRSMCSPGPAVAQLGGAGETVDRLDVGALELRGPAAHGVLELDVAPGGPAALGHLARPRREDGEDRAPDAPGERDGDRQHEPAANANCAATA